MRDALTAFQLLCLRSTLQWSHLYVAVHRPRTLFSARLASVPSAPTASLAYNTGSHNDSVNIPAGMTVYVGSSAGARDKGWLRLRSALIRTTSGSLSVGEFGDKLINFASGDYLTVVEDRRPSPKYPRYSSGTWYMDYDAAYDTVAEKQNDNYGPLPRLGPAAVGFTLSGDCVLRYVGDRSAAYSPGNTIAAVGGYDWSFPNGVTSGTQGTLASPLEITYHSAIPDGQYHSLSVTEDLTGITRTGYRLTFVFDRTGSNAPYEAILVDSLNGGPGQGGYTATLRVINTTADVDDIPEEAHVVIFSEDHFATDDGEYWQTSGLTGAWVDDTEVTGSTSGAIGVVASSGTGYVQIKTTSGTFLPGELASTDDAVALIDLPDVGGNYPYRGNVLMEGWIVAETVRKNPETGEIEFTVNTLDGVLRTLEGYPVALTNRSTTPTLSWEDAKRLTMNTGTLHFVLWRSNIADIVDVMFQDYGPPHTAIMKYLTLDRASVFDQINGHWQRSIAGWVACDLQSAFYCEMDAVIDETVRAQVPTGWTMAKATDLRDELEIPRTVVKSNSQTVLYAVAYRKPLGSKSPGDPHGYQGFTREITEGMVGPLVGGDLSSPDQDTLNTWAGNLRAKANNVYKGVTHRLTGNWRIDPVPQAYFVESFASGDTIRGITLTDQNFIPRELRLRYNDRSWSLLSELTADAETVGIGGVAIEFPPAENPPDVTPTDPPGEEPPITPGLPVDAKEVWVLAGGGTGGIKILWSKDFFNGGQPSWHSIDTPSGYTIIGLDYNNILCVTLDGSAVYLGGNDSNNANRDTIWKLTNTATIRATPATAASWSVIAHSGEAVSIGTLYPVSSSSSFPMRAVADKLYAVFRIVAGSLPYYGVYNGTAWTYTAVGSTASDFGVYRNAVLVADNVSDNKLRIAGGAQYGSDWPHTFGTPSERDLWGLYNSTSHYWVVYKKNGTNQYNLRHINSDTDYNTGLTTGTFRVGGAHGGTYCYVHVSSGELYITSSGASFSLLETFSTGAGGRVMDAKLSGGGKLVRAQETTPTSNTAIFINSTRVAGAWDAMNGDMDTVYPRSGALTLLDLNLVWTP